LKEFSVLQQHIPRLTAIEKKECAESVYSKKEWSRKRRRWLYLYLIYPPKHKPFLPSDESLLTMVGHLPEVAFIESNRFKDRDYFLVFGLKRNIFTTRADFVSRTIRRQFLCEIGQASTTERIVRPSTLEAANLFLAECGFATVEWNGRQLIAHSKDNERYESSRVRGGIYWRPFQILLRACRPELPFSYGAAP
jgi:hypothetical protein